MCLDTISTKVPKTKGLFWKVFHNIAGELHSDCVDTVPVRRRGIWLKATPNKKNYSTSGDLYTLGFHGFTTEKEARQWCRLCGNYEYANVDIIEVKYRRGHSAGTQGKLNVIVADEILIPRRKK